jgi:hypothetical protein
MRRCEAQALYRVEEDMLAIIEWFHCCT